jgi:hypothetical protein
MTEDSIEHLHREITIFDLIEELDTLDIMEKFPDTILFAETGQAVLPEMAVRDMPDIMTECNRFYEIFVEPETSTDRPRNFGDKLNMNYTVGNVVVFHKGKNLGFVNVPGVCPRMDDPVRIAGVRCPDILGFPVVPPHGIGTD